ncbi:hypothetical protein DPMN_087597 [Dreissena polymorpha]|uniref:Uncharacterized protein n=1 Tax=Dreissena polymorpha TaxID=45954 RepID=A0A9D4KSK4_DREPO|nr:hypothetical protein DPMN_087597 [Dreissena polymorpha]
MMACGRFRDDSTMTKGWRKSSKNSTEMQAAQHFSIDRRVTSSGHQWASVKMSALPSHPVQTFPWKDNAEDRKRPPQLTAQLLAHKRPFRRPSNDESWLGLDTSPGTNLCARLCPKARKREVAVKAVRW